MVVAAKFLEVVRFREEDLERWKQEGRLDLLTHPLVDRYVHEFYTANDSSYESVIEFKAELRGLERKMRIKYLWGGYIRYCSFLKRIKKGKYKCLIYETKPRSCRIFPKVIETKCQKCKLNFVRYFKDAMFPETSLEDYLKWDYDGFFEKVLVNVEYCPQCGEPIPKIHGWASKNCPALKATPSIDRAMHKCHRP